MGRKRECVRWRSPVGGKAVRSPHRPRIAASFFVLILFLCGCGARGHARARSPVVGQRASVQATQRCLQDRGYATHRFALRTTPLRNMRPRPVAWLTFFGRKGGGVALFFPSHARAVEAAKNWDRQVQASLCRLLKLSDNCSQGVPRYERKRTRLNVFLNFNLGIPSKQTIRVVESCVRAAGSI